MLNLIDANCINQENYRARNVRQPMQKRGNDSSNKIMMLYCWKRSYILCFIYVLGGVQVDQEDRVGQVGQDVQLEEFKNNILLIEGF